MKEKGQQEEEEEEEYCSGENISADGASMGTPHSADGHDAHDGLPSWLRPDRRTRRNRACQPIAAPCSNRPIMVIPRFNDLPRRVGPPETLDTTLMHHSPS